MTSASPTATILTGGSNGFDDYVGHMCKKYPGFQHFICFPPANKRCHGLTPLTRAQLHAGNPAIEKAGSALGRSISNPIAYQYHQSAAHLVNHANMVFAFGTFDGMRRHVEGGEGWSVQMAKDRGIPLYVFDTDYEEWWWWNPTDKCFMQCEGMTETYVPVPHLRGMVALIGSRNTPPRVFPYVEKLFNNPLKPSSFTFIRT